MSNKTRNRNQQQQPQKDSNMPQDDSTKPSGTDETSQEQASQQASEQAEQTGDATGAPEGGTEITPEQQANADEAAAIREAAGDKVIEELGLLNKNAKVIDQGTQDSSSTKAPEAPLEAPKPDEAALAAAAAGTTEVSTSAREALSIFDQLLERTRVAGTPQQKNLVRQLQQYMEEVAPGKPVTRADGAKWQQTLWVALKGVVDNSDNLEFRKQWFIVLSFFNENGGKKQVFNGRYVFRFAEMWSRSPDELDAMQRLINIIHLTANPEERNQGLKQVDLDRSLATGFSPMARQNLISFYKSN
jgi:hypothetical protein